MKSRIGFISNSSSSSFIIATKDNRRIPCPTCGHIEDNIIDEIGHSNNEDTYVLDTPLNKIIESMKYEEYSNQRILTSYEKLEMKVLDSKISGIRKLANEGYKIYEVNVSNHDTDIIDSMNENEDPNTIIIYRYGD